MKKKITITTLWTKKNTTTHNGPGNKTQRLVEYLLNLQTNTQYIYMYIYIANK